MLFLCIQEVVDVFSHWGFVHVTTMARSHTHTHKRACTNTTKIRTNTTNTRANRAKVEEVEGKKVLLSIRAQNRKRKKASRLSQLDFKKAFIRNSSKKINTMIGQDHPLHPLVPNHLKASYIHWYCRANHRTRIFYKVYRNGRQLVSSATPRRF